MHPGLHTPTAWGRCPCATSTTRGTTALVIWTATSLGLSVLTDGLGLYATNEAIWTAQIPPTT
ncbi:hypothetical protein GCM10009764_64540 [Nocardia ninae]|uniref:Uncharacterized protein n=1 Tax=Nocardia ninae NBRC 108245 TaxID=1210091 RepID=A0A511MDU7_9NOCA|nr:hypothetical protein NN4_33540 [Nocardia ninae NBRC 108245]